MQRGRGREDARRGVGVVPSSSSDGVTAIIAAGGRGERTGSSVPKQFATLGGRPLFSWSLDRLLEWGCEPVILVVPPDHLDAVTREIRDSASVRVVAGGATRQESVANGLQDVEGTRVFVHDAARPFVEKPTLEYLLDALERCDAAVPALPMGETVKEVDGPLVRRTVDRARLVTSQTPQAFRVSTLRSAHACAREEGYVATDDAELIERYGGTVGIVPGSRANIKVTYPEDFALAEAMIRS